MKNSDSTEYLFTRDAGILLHPTSLPNAYGVGDFGPACRKWFDLLAQAQQSLWQVLPLGPAGYGDSPYQALSAFASNPVFLSPEWFNEQGLLSEEELTSFQLPASTPVEYPAVYRNKQWLASLISARFHDLPESHRLRQQFDAFCHAEASWLEDFALFAALKNRFNLKPWHLWPESARDRHPDALEKARRDLAPDLDRVRVEQFFLQRQWDDIREYARDCGIRVVGDLPIFVSHDSSDVWCHRDHFRLNEDGSPSVVAGVPPDYFSKTGQLWGNPLYDWERHASDDFHWWHCRLNRLLQCTDVVRIDHFRGFVATWEIPGQAETAMEGRWIKVPGDRLFESLEKAWNRPLPLIAEDLGVITDEVVALRDRFGLPGIRVMQFAFGSDPMKSTFVPESFITNCVAYTGTHDNDTVRGWFDSQPGEGSVRTAEEIESERKNCLDYFQSDGREIHWDFIRGLYESDAGAAIVPVQDILGLGSDARMNRPGEASGSWQWRLPNLECLDAPLQRLTEWTRNTHRGTSTATRPAPMTALS